MPGAYIATNLISASASITASSEDSAYPKENLYGKQSPNVFRSQSKTSLTLLIGFSTAVQADTIALINHNLTASASLKLEADDSASPTTDVGFPAYRQYNLWKAFTLTSKRYWLLTITDNNPNYIQIGQLLLGLRVALPRARKIGNYSPAVKRSVISGETYGGAFFNYHLFQRQQLNPSFRVGSAAELAILTALDQAVYGNLYPFLYIPESSKSECYYVRKEVDFEPQEYSARLAGPELIHDYQMTLIEESRGMEVLI